MTDPTHIAATTSFTMRPDIYAQAFLARIAGRYWYVAALPATAFMICGVFDWRWMIVALAFVFLIAPMAIMMTWIVVSGRQDAVRAIFPHQVAIYPGGTVRIEYSPLATTADDGAVTLRRQPEGIVIHPDDIRSCDLGKKRMEIWYRHPDPTGRHNSHLLIVPYSAFAGDAECRAFIQASDMANRMQAQHIND